MENKEEAINILGFMDREIDENKVKIKPKEKMNYKRYLLWGIGLIMIILTMFTLAQSQDTDTPMINFTNPTPRNSSIIWNTFLNTTNLINISINASQFDTFIFNWNTTNYTIYNNSLVLMLNFDNRSGIGENASKVVDVSIYSNNGTCAGTSCPILNLSGKYGNAMQFDGVNDYITVTDTASLKLSSSITISAWIFPSTLPSETVIVRKGANSNCGNYNFFIHDSKLALLSSDSCAWGNEGTNSKISTNAWQYVLVTYNGANIKYYINNSLRDTIVADGLGAVDTNPVEIGGRQVWGVAGYFNGTIDEVRIWNRSLSSEEINQSYYSNLYKYQSNTWNYITNQSNLVNGTYTYYGYVNNSLGYSNFTETRTLCVNTSGGYTNDCPAPPSAPAGDTCTYTSGDYNINWQDNCTITTLTNVLNNNVNIVGCGRLTLQADVINVRKLTYIKTPENSQLCQSFYIGGSFKGT